MRAGGERVEIAVEDTGIGMRPDQLAGLYQPFNRLGREASAVEGTGIGLVIARNLVGLMGGSLAVQSEPGRGTQFRIDLPAANDRPAAMAPAAPLSAQAPAALGGAQAFVARPEVRGRLLYIDDNRSNRALMAAYLMRRPNVELTLAPDAASGLAQARRKPPTLVLLDILMPRADGYAALAALRARPGLQTVPCVAISAGAMPGDRQRALDAGFDGYLTKPLALASLLQTVDGWLAPAAG